MIRSLFLACSLCFGGSLTSLFAQSYYQLLLDELATSYNLPGGRLLHSQDELEVINSLFDYGGTRSTGSLSGQPFSISTSFSHNRGNGNAYDAAMVLSLSENLQAGERGLIVFWCKASQLGSARQGEVYAYLERNSTPYDKLGGALVFTDTSWYRVMLPFHAQENFLASQMQLSIQTGLMSQEITVGGIAVISFGTDVDRSRLPTRRNTGNYAGSEPGAPWRAAARERIKSLRKAEMSVQLQTLRGEPIPNTPVRVKMLRHDYGFGAAVMACRVQNLRCYTPAYVDKLNDLDGRGNRFSEVVFENDLKWPAWEQNWFGSNDEVVDALSYYVDSLGFRMRGHTLVWPCPGNMPPDVEARLDDPAYVRQRIRDHFIELLTHPGIKDRILDWDVINEVAVCPELADVFAGSPGYPTGREIYAELFRLADSLQPGAQWVYNDYQTLQIGDFFPQRRQTFIRNAREIRDSGAPIYSVGLQSHMEWPLPPPRILELMDEVYDSLGLRIKITEFDLTSFDSPELEAQYLRDFYTAVFSHPSSDAILSWGFWDGAHWRDNGILFDRDWNLKPSGQAFFDLVFGEWLTDTLMNTDVNGELDLSAFKGQYEIQLLQTGERWETHFTADSSFVFQSGLLSTDALAGLSPKPVLYSSGSDLLLESAFPNAEIRVYDALGRPVWSGKTDAVGRAQLPSSFWQSGLYTVQLREHSLRTVLMQ